jgi:hypothetical protein
MACLLAERGAYTTVARLVTARRRDVMADTRKWQESIRIGFQVFDKDGGEEFGAVRDVCPHGRLELLVNIENGGDHCIPLQAIVDVHSEKVIVDARLLAPAVQYAIAHAHDAERPGL